MTKEELQQIREIMREELEPVNQKIENLEEKTDRNRTEIMAYIESRVEKQIQLLAEGHQLIIEKMAQKERIDDLEQRVKTIEHILETNKPA